ncbi:2-phosphosulfolactate phosphatase family protein [soil metagenome]
MRLDVFLTPGELSPSDLVERVVVVIDILRASTTIVEALANGAKSIYPASSIEEALRLANTFGRDDVLLCGERKCLPIEGFDLGNSPREFTRDRVAGKTLVMSTTNGTIAIGLTSGAARVYIGSLLNLRAVVEELALRKADPVLVCSGREKHFALEDAACAGLIAAQLIGDSLDQWQLNDGARAALALASEFGVDEDLFRTTMAGKNIAAAGLAEDLSFCARMDVHDILPVLHERNVTLVTAPVGIPS